MSEILQHREAGVLTLTFNRLDKKNAITTAMYTRLAEELEAATADDSVRVAVIQGAVEIFTAGNDLADFLNNPPISKPGADVLKRLRGGEVDLSRVDSMIAVRMRVTGHDQAAIEGAIRQCAPATRQKGEGRDWNDYAQRTARYAYSAAGDRQAAELGKYRQQWEKLEGREPVRQQEQAKAQKIERDNSPGMSR